MHPVEYQRFERPHDPNEAAPSDRELLERFIASRDEQAFETLVRLHGPLVLGVCRRVIGHHHDAEEAFQATFLVLARKAASVRPPEMVANWLYGVAWRTALKMRTTIAQRRAKEVQVTVIPEPKASQSDHWNEIAPLLDRELSRLPDKYRAAVVSCDLEGRSRRDAALQLGWPEGTLKVRLMQARAILTRRLARQGVVLSVGALAAVVSQHAASAAVPSALVATTAKAAGALAATKAVPTAAVGAKRAALAKGTLKSVFLGKAAVATTAAGVTIAAALFVASAEKPTSSKQTSDLKLPVAVQQALEENARQLSPLSVTSTSRFVSRLSPTETLERLHMPTARPDRFFEEQPCRVIWQDQQFYMSRKFNAGAPGQTMKATSEITFDGLVFSVGSIYEMPKRAGVPGQRAPEKPGPKENQHGLPVVNRVLSKEPVAKAMEVQPGGINNLNTYFRPETGLVLQPDSQSRSVGGRIVERKLHADSAVLDSLSHGGKLISVENVPVEGKPCVRIQIEAPNPLRRLAEAIDLEKQREMLKRSRETPQRQAEMLRALEELKSLPATRQYIYYLDPSLHYAVRRCDQRYGPDLLSRSDCSQFEQIPGRQLWLARKVETELHEYYSVPGMVIKDSFLTQIVEVSALDGSRVPDETFKLNYTQPGTLVKDGTDPEAKTKDGYLNYTVPARPEQLAGVIARARSGESTLQADGMPLAAEPLAEPYRRGPLLTLALANLAIFAAVVGFLVWRRRRGDVL